MTEQEAIDCLKADKETRKLRMEGLTYKQIAERLHCWYNTVWRRLKKLDWSDEQ